MPGVGDWRRRQPAVSVGDHFRDRHRVPIGRSGERRRGVEPARRCGAKQTSTAGTEEPAPAEPLVALSAMLIATPPCRRRTGRCRPRPLRRRRDGLRCPALNRMNVGIDRMPNRAGTSSTTSVSTFATIRRPDNAARHLLQLGRDDPAWAAPGRPEIDEHRQRRFADQRIELTGGVEIDGLAGRRQIGLTAAAARTLPQMREGLSIRFAALGARRQDASLVSGQRAHLRGSQASSAAARSAADAMCISKRSAFPSASTIIGSSSARFAAERRARARRAQHGVSCQHRFVPG